MKAKTLALSLALLMMVAVLFAVPMVSANTEPEVYDPRVEFLAEADRLAAGAKTAVFDGNYKAMTYVTTGTLAGQTVVLNAMSSANSDQQTKFQIEGKTGNSYGFVSTYNTNKSGLNATALRIECGTDSNQQPMVVFTAPSDGVYDISNASGYPNITTKTTSDPDGITVTFSVEKFAKGSESLAPEAGEVKSSAALVFDKANGKNKTNNAVAFPAVSGVTLKAGEMIVFRLTHNKSNLSWGWWTTTEVAPIVTRVGDLPKDIEVEEPELILEPIVYNPITSLNAAAGDYGLGGSACVADTYGTATFDDVFTATAKEGGDWKMGSYAPEKPLNTVWVRSTNHLRLYPGQYCIHDGKPYSSNYGNIEIYQYNNGYQVMWWTPGGNYDYKVAEVAFTAAYDGVYDITAPAGFDTVSRTPAAIRDGSAVADKEITFAIVKGDETLNSVTVKGDESKPFPAVNGVKLKAGDQVFFRVSTNFTGSKTQYGLAIEANPIITRRADAPMAPFDNATAGILDMAELPEGKQGLRFTQELTTTDGEAGEVLVLGDKVFDVKFIGMLAAVKANLGEDELTLDTTATNAAIQNSAVTSYRAKKENGNTNVYTFSALITNIAAANKAVSVSVRAYLVCEDAEGNEYVFYGKTLTSSVLNVYNYAKNAGHDFYDTVDAWMA